MKRNQHRLSELGHLCAEPGPGDGRDPRYDRNDVRADQGGAHERRLCRHAQRLLQLILGGEMLDPALTHIEVMAVELDAGSGCFQVLLTLPATADEKQRQAASAALVRLRGQLRTAIARSARRRRIPDLRFALLPEVDHAD